MTKEQVLEELHKSKSVSDFYKRHGYTDSSISGNMLKELREYAVQIGFDLDLYNAEKQYNKNPEYCLTCGKVIPYNKYRNKFCCHSCSAKYSNLHREPVHTPEMKNKISTTLSEKEIRVCCKCGESFEAQKVSKIDICYTCRGLVKINNKVRKIFTKICLICNKEFRAYFIGKKCCSEQCRKIYVNNKTQERIKNGTFSGWKSRNITSYPERFFIKVLENNNILNECKINFPITKLSLGLSDSVCYFLDFYFPDIKLDLEIDGKQHKYEDRKKSDLQRDKILQNNGIIVYRIKWKSINTDEGKNYIKQEIEKFMEMYSKCKHLK